MEKALKTFAAAAAMTLLVACTGEDGEKKNLSEMLDSAKESVDKVTELVDSTKESVSGVVDSVKELTGTAEEEPAEEEVVEAPAEEEPTAETLIEEATEGTSMADDAIVEEVVDTMTESVSEFVGPPEPTADIIAEVEAMESATDMTTLEEGTVTLPEGEEYIEALQDAAPPAECPIPFTCPED